MKRKENMYVYIEKKEYKVKNYKEAKRIIYQVGKKGKTYVSYKINEETGVITEKYEYKYTFGGIIFIKKTYSLIEEQIKEFEKRQLKLFDI